MTRLYICVYEMLDDEVVRVYALDMEEEANQGTWAVACTTPPLINVFSDIGGRSDAEGAANQGARAVVEFHRRPAGPRYKCVNRFFFCNILVQFKFVFAILNFNLFLQCTSTVYVWNSIEDLPADRVHIACMQRVCVCALCSCMYVCLYKV